MTELVPSRIEVHDDVVLTEHAGWELVQAAEEMLDVPGNAEGAAELWRRVRAVEQAMRYAQLSSAITVAMGRVRLRAEARWGELLGPVEDGAPEGNQNAAKNNVTDGHVVSDTERKTRERARRVAKVRETAPEVFEEYIVADHDDPPTRAGLFRAAEEAQPTRRQRRDEWDRGDKLQVRLARVAREAQWIETHVNDYAYVRGGETGADKLREYMRKIDARLAPLREAMTLAHHEFRQQVRESEK